jgi:hypothetical protein
MGKVLSRHGELRREAAQREHTLVADQPDLTLDEVVSAMHKRGIAGSRSAVWRFFQRHKVTFKKKPAGGRAEASRRGSGTPALDAGAGYALYDSAGVHRRDRCQYQNGAAKRPLPTRRSARRPCAVRTLEDDHLRGRPAPQWNDRAMRA